MVEVAETLAVVGAAVVAIALLARRPTHAVTVVLVLMTTVTVWSQIQPLLGLDTHDSRVGNALWALTLPMIAPLITVFPDGPRGRLGRTLVCYQTVTIAWSVVAGYLGNEVGGEPTWWFRVAQVLLVGLLLSGVVATVSLGRHLRRSPPQSRARISVVFAVAAVIASLYVLGGTATLLLPTRGTPLDVVLEALTVLLLVGGLPIAIGFSVLSEQPRRAAGVVNVALSWTLRIALAGILGLLTANGVALLIGTRAGDPLVVLVPVVLVLVAAPWLARAARRPADAIAGADAAGAAALRRLSDDLSTAVNVTEIPQLVARTIGELFPVTGVVVETGADDHVERAAQWGDAAAGAASVAAPLVHAGRTVGRLRLTAPDRRQAQDAAEAAAVVLPHVAAALDAAILTLDLERAHRSVLAVRAMRSARGCALTCTTNSALRWRGCDWRRARPAAA